MKSNITFLLFFLSLFVILYSLLFPHLVFAHEAYVLTPQQFNQGLKYTGIDAFSALQKPDNLRIFIEVSLGVTVALILNFLFRLSKNGQKFYNGLNRFEKYGQIPVRIALFGSFFYSAITNSFLGPEIPITQIPFSEPVKFILLITSFLFLFGFLTELAALLAFIAFLLGTVAKGSYLITYLNYLGEIIALLLFGTRVFSLDRILFGKLKRFPKLQEYEGTIIRVFYGIALAYAAISIKLIHPILTITVVNEYHLTQFHWLFPQDPLLVTLGAAMAEFAIGFFIIIGFQTRLVVLVSLFYITLSLLYFKEVVWPHFLLYGISLNLLLNDGGKLTLDSFIDKWRLPKKLFTHIRG